MASLAPFAVQKNIGRIFSDQLIFIRVRMARDVDNVSSNLKSLHQIIRPPKPNAASTSMPKEKSGHSSFQIEKSFKPEAKSLINEALRPELDELKAFLKRKNEAEKRMKAMVAQGKISRQAAGVAQIKEPVKQVVEKVVVDESGQVRDEDGNLLFVKSRRTDLMINQKKEQETQIKSLEKKQRMKHHQRLSRKLLDRNLLVSSSKKRMRRYMLGLQFLEKGSYQAVSRVKTEVKLELQNIADVFLEDNEATLRVVKRRNKIQLQFNKELPEIQWWDAAILNATSYAQIIGTHEVNNLPVEEFLKEGVITEEVRYQRVGEENKKEERIVMPMYLTKDQRKKLKRKRKREKLLEKNDKIKLGLIEPEKPKLRVGNMAIVLKNQFIVDPSRIEAEAKKQTEERLNKHLQSNNSRKLNKKQRKDKFIRKLKRDSAKECRRLVFRLNKLDDEAEIFKVNINAKQLALNGLVIKPVMADSQPTVIIVQGGPKAIRFYKNLMMNRIRWGEHDPTNKCKLVWEGAIEESVAGKWKTYEVSDEVQSIRVLTEKKLEHFWDYVVTD